MAVLAVVLVAVILFARPASPGLGDYAEWTYHGVLLRDVLAGHADAGYWLKSYPVPNSLTTWVLGGLMLALPWSVAAKLWLVCGAMLGVGAATALHRAAGGRTGAPVVVLLAAAFLGTAFWAGFTNFLAGTAFAMLMAALLLRGVRRGWAYGVLLLAAFFSHMIPFGFALLLLAAYAWQYRAWRLLWQTAPALAMTVWYFAGRALHGNADSHAGMVATVATISARFLVFKANTFLKGWGLINPALGLHDSLLLADVGTTGFLLLLVLNLVVAAVVLGVLVEGARRSLRSRGTGWFLWLTVVTFFGVACVMPGALAGISDPGGRMMQVAMWTGVAAGSPGMWRRWPGVVAAGASVVLLAMNMLLIERVAMRVPVAGAMDGRLPAPLREFAHVYYADRYWDYAAITRGAMDQEIYPTALFLKRR